MFFIDVHSNFEFRGKLWWLCFDIFAPSGTSILYRMPLCEPTAVD